MHTRIISDKKGRGYESEWGRVYGRIWKEAMER